MRSGAYGRPFPAVSDLKVRRSLSLLRPVNVLRIFPRIRPEKLRVAMAPVGGTLTFGSGLVLVAVALVCTKSAHAPRTPVPRVVADSGVVGSSEVEAGAELV